MMNDRQFAKSFSWMIFLLVLLTIVLIIIGIMAGSGTDAKLRAQTAEFTQQLVASRTQPVGTLNVGEMAKAEMPEQPEPAAASAVGAIQVAASGGVGEAVYNQGCHICHNAGVTGAPKPGDVADWEPRIAKGIEMLYANAINGYTGEKGVMPPKGGNIALSDEDVKAAVDYLVELVQQ